MRTALVFLVLLLSACGNTTGDGRRTSNIDKSYAARDACLARNAAADDISNSDPATLARAVALACSSETEQLVMAANRDGDSKVAAARDFGLAPFAFTPFAPGRQKRRR